MDFKGELIKCLRDGTKESDWEFSGSALFHDNDLPRDFGGIHFGTYNVKYTDNVETSKRVFVSDYDFKHIVTFEDVFCAQTETQEEREALDMTDTTSKQAESLVKGDGVEWKNGDECQHKNGVIFTFIGKCDNPKEFDCVLMDSSGNAVLSFTDELSKPESAEQKAERERLESAYDLYCNAQHAVDVIGYDSFGVFRSDKVQVKFWLSIVDKTGYRKAK